MLRKILVNVLQQLTSDLEAGTCNITEAEMGEVIDAIREMNDRSRLSKYSACQYLHLKRAKFDELVRNGKLPPGKKEVGFKEKVWYKSELDSASRNLQ